MIPASPGYEARFRKPGEATDHDSPRPVVAWDDEGEALVVEGSRLAVAKTLPHFFGVSPVVPPGQVIPGGGWVADVEYAGQRSVDRVVAWLISPDGFGCPLFADDRGSIQQGADPEPPPEIKRVWHPGVATLGGERPPSGPASDGGGDDTGARP